MKTFWSFRNCKTDSSASSLGRKSPIRRNRMCCGLPCTRHEDSLRKHKSVMNCYHSEQTLCRGESMVVVLACCEYRNVVVLGFFDVFWWPVK